LGFQRGALLGLLGHPPLLIEGLRAWFAMSRIGGVTPSASYLEWRRFTAYGDRMATVGAKDLIDYLSWRRSMRLVRSWEPVA
jgi:hypothetical protein